MSGVRKRGSHVFVIFRKTLWEPLHDLFLLVVELWHPRSLLSRPLFTGRARPTRRTSYVGTYLTLRVHPEVATASSKCEGSMYDRALYSAAVINVRLCHTEGRPDGDGVSYVSRYPGVGGAPAPMLNASVVLLLVMTIL